MNCPKRISALFLASFLFLFFAFSHQAYGQTVFCGICQDGTDRAGLPPTYGLSGVCNIVPVGSSNAIYCNRDCTVTPPQLPDCVEPPTPTPTPPPPPQAPIIPFIPGTSVAAGTTYNIGSIFFTDPDSSSWTAKVDYGDGTVVSLGSVFPGNSISLSHLYLHTGNYAPILSITDDQGLVGARTMNVLVGTYVGSICPPGTDIAGQIPKFGTNIQGQACQDLATGQTPYSNPNAIYCNRDCSVPAVLSSPALTNISPAKVWIGLKNITDIGAQFDLKAEAYVNGTLITSGQINTVFPGLTGLFVSANQAIINFNPFSPVNVPTGSTLAIKVYVRNACAGSLRPNNADAKIWYNDSAANSQFGATIGGNTKTYYLVSGAALSTSVGIGPKQTIDVAAGTRCSAFKLFGTWTGTP